MRRVTTMATVTLIGTATDPRALPANSMTPSAGGKAGSAALRR